MKHWTKLLFTLLIGGTLGMIKCEGTLAEIKEQYPNRLTAGLNFAQSDLKVNIGDVKAEGNRLFSGIYLGYEYRKPEGFYLSFDVSGSSSDRKFSIYAKDIDENRSLHLGLGRSSLLFGYTNTYCNWLLTPYVGFGTFLIENHDTKEIKLSERVRTFNIGMRADYSFNDSFDLGVNLQLFNLCGLKEYRLKDTSDYLVRSFFESFGLSISLPITYHYGETLQWDIKVEPYYTLIAYKQNQRTYGANLLIGYNF